jgi:hypothetical protein
MEYHLPAFAAQKKKKDVLVIFLGKYKFENVLKHVRAIFNSYIVIRYSLDIANQCAGIGM